MTAAGRVLAALAVLVVVGLLAAGAILLWPAAAPPAVAATPATPDLIARGQYLATAADCIACHTTPGGKPYAGGRAFRLPFGTIYSPNITPDPATGIGGWSDGQFVRAVRQGVGAKGEELYPAFPYTSYHRMSDADAVAIKAYLFSLGPVQARVEANSLVFPFNQRPLMRFWKLLFMPSRGFTTDPGRSAEWNRGAYLVTALGHCGECHTPRNLLYGLNGGQALSGETMQGWTAWNITSDPSHGIGAWSADEIAAYLRYGYAPRRGAANGPMKEAVDFSLSRLTPADLHAIAAYLKASPAKDRGPAADVRPPAMVDASFVAPAGEEENADRIGRRVFEGACVGCHAWNGQGQANPMAALAGLPSVADPDATNVVQTVVRGSSVATPQGHAFMPAFGRSYSNAEIAAVSNYVVEHFGGQTGRATAKAVARARLD